MERNILNQDDAVNGNLNGTEGADRITASGEIVSAGGGDDVVRVDEGGNTIVSLGAGQDVLRLNEDGAQARVIDFDQGADTINLRALGVQDFGDLDIDSLASVNDPADGTIIRAGGAEIKLLDVDPNDLNAGDFNFSGTSAEVEDDDSAIELDDVDVG